MSERQATYTTVTRDAPPARPERCVIYANGHYERGELPVGIFFSPPPDFLYDQPVGEKQLFSAVTLVDGSGAAWTHYATYRIWDGDLTVVAFMFRAKNQNGELLYAAVLDDQVDGVAPVGFRNWNDMTHWLACLVRDLQTIATAPQKGA